MSEELKSCPFCGSSGNCDVAFPHPSENPTNWPNPERPGVPMFPERDGWHNFIGHQNVRPDEDDGESPDVSPIYLFCCWWDSELRTWSGFDETPWCIDDCADLLRDEEYHGPALTPTQIAEMLAGERERSAQEAISIGENWNGTELSPTNTARHIAHAIRNLGDAT
ncbi:hypothetical protein JK165_08685 [Acetobacter okinawensis]|uniref:hypothetical protein n=1 Tax=Acetobacter okinawensis TaxID=1076594 RepID=UPI001BA6EE88|nr:hypothetical protein [Acetobacter okinawensis]MBS0966160.1 hypothetical protein [Acetobacter okinawensis]